YRPTPRGHHSAGAATGLQSLDRVHAAAGVYLAAPGIEEALPGGVLQSVRTEAERTDAMELLAREVAATASLAETGVQICADTLGGLEALAFECTEAKIPIHGAEVGPVTRALLLRTATVKDPLHRAVLAFNVPVLPEAEGEAAAVRVFRAEVMYRLLEEYLAWKTGVAEQMEKSRRIEFVHPAKFEILDGYVFRASKPAIVGIRVLAGELRTGVRIMRSDGTEVALLKSLQKESDSVKVAAEGTELAASLDGAVVGRTVREGDILYVSLPESSVRALRAQTLTPSERGVLEEVVRLRRATEGPFWGQ
ncbi:MAG: eukaryotic translation initiation factor 5B, partial [Thermoplasmata archaeon]